MNEKHTYDKKESAIDNFMNYVCATLPIGLPLNFFFYEKNSAISFTPWVAGNNSK